MDEEAIERKVTREGLYEQVWNTPMQTLAREYGMGQRTRSILLRHKINADELIADV